MQITLKTWRTWIAVFIKDLKPQQINVNNNPLNKTKAANEDGCAENPIDHINP